MSSPTMIRMFGRAALARFGTPTTRAAARPRQVANVRLFCISRALRSGKINEPIRPDRNVGTSIDARCGKNLRAGGPIFTAAALDGWRYNGPGGVCYAYSRLDAGRGGNFSTFPSRMDFRDSASAQRGDSAKRLLRAGGADHGWACARCVGPGTDRAANAERLRDRKQ